MLLIFDSSREKLHRRHTPVGFGADQQVQIGLLRTLDDPRHVNERMRGATPPNVYELEPRQQLFHGVQALRLKPVGGGDIYGRTHVKHLLAPKALDF